MKRIALMLLTLLTVSALLLTSGCEDFQKALDKSGQDLSQMASEVGEKITSLTPTKTETSTLTEPIGFGNWSKQARNWANVRETYEDWHRKEYCLQFVADAFMQRMYAAAGYGSAQLAFDGLKNRDLAKDKINENDWEQLPAGVLIFFGPEPANGKRGHVGIYKGNGLIIHVPNNQAQTDDLKDLISRKDSQGNVVYNYVGWGYPPDEWRPKADSGYPVVNKFEGSGDTFSRGQVINISYLVSDNSGSELKQVELWMATDIDGDGLPNWPESNTGYVIVSNITHNGSLGVFEYTLRDTGTFWFGIHVVNNAGKWTEESNTNSGWVPEKFHPLKISVE